MTLYPAPQLAHEQALAAWSPDAWSALGNMLLGVGAVIAGVWTLFNYYRNRRADAARWLQQLFSDFHLDGQFDEIRTALEYDYDSMVGPLVERRITDRDVPLSEDDRRLLLQLDTLLNFFEHVLYLEAERHLNTKDRQRSTNNWFEIMSSDHMAGLRRYSGRFGFKRVAHALGAKTATTWCCTDRLGRICPARISPT